MYDTCLYNKNCQFLAKHQKTIVDSCTAYKDATNIVEVVRCKDCEWWTKQENSAQGRCSLLGIYPTGYWYCGNGRKGE